MSRFMDDYTWAEMHTVDDINIIRRIYPDARAVTKNVTVGNDNGIDYVVTDRNGNTINIDLKRVCQSTGLTETTLSSLWRLPEARATPASSSTMRNSLICICSSLMSVTAKTSSICVLTGSVTHSNSIRKSGSSTNTVCIVQTIGASSIASLYPF